MNELLDLDALSALPSFELRARALAEGYLSGERRAKKLGGAAEFAEHRPYAPGDPLRDVDWRLCGRSDKYYVRRREEEKHLLVQLVLDASGSMSFGGPKSKLRFASYLAAALAYLGTRGRHAVGLSILGGDAPERFLPARAAGDHLSRILSALEQTRATGALDVPGALLNFAERSPRRALLFAVSDLMAFPPEAENSDEPLEPLALQALSGLAARGHDVVLLHVLDPAELSLPYRGMYDFESLEEQGKFLIDADGLRESYREVVEEYLAQIRKRCEASRIEYHLARTDQALDRVLLAIAAARRLVRT
jgi:uncharacterized protein (DUF58 family)